MGPVFHSHSSQMPLYSVPPPFIPPFRLPLFPPPINDPFVQVFLPQWAGGPRPKTSGLSWNCFFLHSIICGLSILRICFFSYLFSFFIAVFVSFFFSFTTCPHAYSSFTIFVLIRHQGWWIFEIPCLPFVHYAHWCSTFFHQKPLLSFTPLVLLPFHIVFHSILSTLAETLKNRFLVLCWDAFPFLWSRQQPEQEADKKKKKWKAQIQRW